MKNTSPEIEAFLKEMNSNSRKYEITATLSAAVWSAEAKGSIYGYIQGDTKGRFRNGEPIYTSTVMEDLGNGLYRTRNSIYKVNFHSEEGRPEGL